MELVACSHAVNLEINYSFECHVPTVAGVPTKMLENWNCM